jgi:hypothetical protein
MPPPSAEATVPPLYRRILGARFDELPEVLHRFHGSPEGARAFGTLRIQRTPGWFHAFADWLAQFPPAGVDVPVLLTIAVDGPRERWTRMFGSHRLITDQWEWNGLLMERAGPVSFACSLGVDGSCLRYEFQRAWLLGLPLPRWMSPWVISWVEAENDRWWLVVRVIVPFLGETVSYEGWIKPECA